MTSSIIEDFVQYHKGYGILPNDTIAPSFEKALSEIKKGKKVSHWAWYIIPINKAHQEPSNINLLLKTRNK